MARNASIVATAFLLSRLLGFAREVLIANQFGTQGEASAYVAAFRVPDLLFLVIMAGSFGSAFIPVFAGFLGRHEDAKATNLANAVLTWALVATIVAAALMFALAEPILRYIVAPDLSEQYLSLAVDLMRLLLLSPILLGLGIAAKGILEAQDQFTLPALAPLIYNLGIIFGALFLTPRFGIHGLAIGVVIGALGHIGIQLPGLIRAGIHFRPTFSRDVEGLSDVWRLLVPRVIGQAAFQANFIIVTAFASRVGDGGPSAVNYAWQLLMLPHGILALSISTVIFPTMSRQFDTGDAAGLRRTFGQALRPLLFLSIPASIGLFAFREPIVRIIYQTGAFDEESTALVVAPLAYLSLCLVAYGVVEVLTRAFYAMRDARTPVITSLAAIAINVGVSSLTIDRLGLGGLGLGLGLSTVFEGLVLGVVLLLRLRAVGMTIGGGWAGWLARVVLANAALAAVVALLGPTLDELTSANHVEYYVKFGAVCVAILLAAVTYGFAALVIGLPEMTMITTAIEQRLEPILRRHFPRLAAMLPRHQLAPAASVQGGRSPSGTPDGATVPARLERTAGTTSRSRAEASATRVRMERTGYDDLPLPDRPRQRLSSRPRSTEVVQQTGPSRTDQPVPRSGQRPKPAAHRSGLSRPARDRAWLDDDPWAPAAADTGQRRPPPGEPSTTRRRRQPEDPGLRPARNANANDRPQRNRARPTRYEP